MIESRAPNEKRHIFHRKDSFSRRALRGVPFVGGALEFLPEFGSPTKPGRGLNTAFSAGGRPCPVGFSGDGGGNCVPNVRQTLPMEVKKEGGVVPFFERLLPGGATGYEIPFGEGTPPGAPVMGQYGAGVIPGSRIINRAVCWRGMVLGNDGLCYSRKQIRNSDREWPRGARPLGTPGEMRALRIADQFAGRMDRTNERLQTLGLLKKPTTTRKKRTKLIPAKC